MSNRQQSPNTQTRRTNLWVRYHCSCDSSWVILLGKIRIACRTARSGTCVDLAPGRSEVSGFTTFRMVHLAFGIIGIDVFRNLDFGRTFVGTQPIANHTSHGYLSGTWLKKTSKINTVIFSPPHKVNTPVGESPCIATPRHL